MINKKEKHIYAHLPQPNLNFAFVQACKEGDLRLIKFLLFDKKITNAKVDFYEYLGLLEACKAGHLHVVDFFLTSKEFKKNPSINIKKGQLLKISFDIGNLELIDYLLKFPNAKRLDLNQNKDEIFISLMHKFVENQDLIKKLIFTYNLNPPRPKGRGFLLH